MAKRGVTIGHWQRANFAVNLGLIVIVDIHFRTVPIFSASRQAGAQIRRLRFVNKRENIISNTMLQAVFLIGRKCSEEFGGGHPVKLIAEQVINN